MLSPTTAAETTLRPLLGRMEAVLLVNFAYKMNEYNPKNAHQCPILFFHLHGVMWHSTQDLDRNVLLA